MSLLTLSEAETKHPKAVEFLRRIGNDDPADQFDAMDARECAEHKGAELIENPGKGKGNRAMANGKTKADLQSELDEANDYIEELEAKLDDIAGIAADEDEEEDDDEEVVEEEGDDLD
jgi:hypothetical protein